MTHLPARVDATTNDRRAVTAPFTAGGRLYRLGHRGNLGVCVSTDKGETWSEGGGRTKGQSWHQSACNPEHTERPMAVTGHTESVGDKGQ